VLIPSIQGEHLDESQRLRLDAGERLRIAWHRGEFTKYAERLVHDAHRARELFTQGHLSDTAWMMNLSESMGSQLQTEHNELRKILEARGIAPNP
jgi:hypothetical protein